MIARPVSLLPFHGLMLTVLEAQGVQYVPFRPVVSLLGLDWKMARRTAGTADNAELYGLQELACLPTDVYLGEPEAVEALLAGQNCSAGPASAGCQTANPGYGYPEKTLLTKQLCLRLDRVHMYLARVNTSILRAKGKAEAADWLLAMQKEWAGALYQYEMHGIAVKAGQHKSLKELFVMRRHAVGEEKARLSYLIALALDGLGCPREEEAQQEMFGGAA
jgi:hypothetical protein|nr:MAG TPA: hypothetical protein [Herelleviridae sp.]